VVNRVAMAARRSKFTAVMVWCLSTKNTMRNRKMRYKDPSILYCVEICVKL
jgi:hypothetical protein